MTQKYALTSHQITLIVITIYNICIPIETFSYYEPSFLSFSFFLPTIATNKFIVF